VSDQTVRSMQLSDTKHTDNRQQKTMTHVSFNQQNKRNSTAALQCHSAYDTTT